MEFFLFALDTESIGIVFDNTMSLIGFYRKQQKSHSIISRSTYIRWAIMRPKWKHSRYVANFPDLARFSACFAFQWITCIFFSSYFLVDLQRLTHTPIRCTIHGSTIASICQCHQFRIKYCVSPFLHQICPSHKCKHQICAITSMLLMTEMTDKNWRRPVTMHWMMCQHQTIGYCQTVNSRANGNICTTTMKSKKT